MDLVDRIIMNLSSSPPRNRRFTNMITDDDLMQLFVAATNAFRSQPTLVTIRPPVVVVGDIHGQFADLQRIFSTHGLPSDRQYVFLGDYVDRGQFSLETIILLFCYKVKYPANLVLLRGNHECAEINIGYGFYAEIERRWRRPHVRRLFDRFNQVFAWMPFVALIGEKILCMHGGISDRLISMDQLTRLSRPRTELALNSLEMDLLWSDPAPGVHGVIPNTRRRAGVMFGEDVVDRVLAQLGLDYIFRAHEAVPDGVRFFANGHMVTIFSAPGYVGRRNTAATMTVESDLSHTITRFPPA